MTVTVETCMKLPSFRAAKLVAGKSGKKHPVNSITVLEYADPDLISSELFLNGEICITAFTSIKNDVEKQCAVLRRMKGIGLAAMVIYYIGIFVPALDERVINVADEIGLPLFCMPTNRMDFRYGEMINDVMDAIYRSQHEGQNFVAPMLDSIALLSENLRTIRSVLRMLSDRLRCTLFLMEPDGTVRSDAQWPISAQWDCCSMADTFRSNLHEYATFQKCVLDQKQVNIACVPLQLSRRTSMRLVLLDDLGQVSNKYISQAAEVVTTFLNISDYVFPDTTPDMLVRSIIDDEPLRMREIATQHNIDMHKFQAMWIAQPRGYSSSYQSKQQLGKCVAMTQNFFRNQKRRALTDSYQNAVVTILELASFADFDKDLIEPYLKLLSSQGDTFCLSLFPNMFTTKDARSAYQLYANCFDSLQLIFPTRNLFRPHDFHFVEKCKKIVDAGGNELSDSLSVLQPLHQMRDYESMIETLAAYFLDADMNLQKTSELLFVHRNTIKYRIGQIREALDCDFNSMPMASTLYEAVAITRLMKQ